jgi:hypothetical protein
MTRAPEILSGLGVDAAAQITETQHPVPLPSRLAVGELAWTAVGTASLAAAEIAGASTVTLDPDRIALAYASERHGRLDGQAPTAFAPLSGFFRTLDGWVRTHGNYPHHARALRDGLGLSEDADARDAASALASMTADDASRAITSRGGVCSEVVNERREVDDGLRLEPLVRVVRTGAARPRALSASTTAPLAGVRVLDLTRVIAGPVATRTLALFGADVLRVDPPRIPEIRWQHLDTGHGKRSTLLDLSARSDRARFDALVETADVVVLGYRPDGLARLRLSPEALAAQHPSIVIAQLSAWGSPDQRGFDSIIQAASGISWIESRDGTAPGALPAQALDHSAGYLLAAAVMAALKRRAVEGGSWLVSTSLRRIAAELLGMPRAAEASVFGAVDPTSHTQMFRVDGSELETVAPAPAYEGGPSTFAPPRPWGEDDAVWLER